MEGDCKEACVLLAEVGSHRREYRGGCRESLKNQKCPECLSICNRVFVYRILGRMRLCKVSRPAAKIWISMRTQTILANVITAVVEGRRCRLLTASEIWPHCAIACRTISLWSGMSSRWRTVLVIVNKMLKMRECYKTHVVKKIYEKTESTTWRNVIQDCHDCGSAGTAVIGHGHSLHQALWDRLKISVRSSDRCSCAQIANCVCI